MKPRFQVQPYLPQAVEFRADCFTGQPMSKDELTR